MTGPPERHRTYRWDDPAAAAAAARRLDGLAFFAEIMAGRCRRRRSWPRARRADGRR